MEALVEPEIKEASTEQPADRKPRRERGEGRIWQVGKRWWIQYYVNGRQVRETSRSTTKAVAERKLKKRLAEVEAGLAPNPHAERVAYESLRDAFYADHRINHMKSLQTRKDGTEYIGSVLELDRFFGGCRAVDITPDRIRQFITKRQAAAAPNSTINRSLAALRRMFHLAVKDKKLRDVPPIQMLKEPPPRKGFLEHEAYLRLREALPDYLRPVVAMGYYTGMRRAEILGLRWDNVDLLNAQVRLDPGTTKNDEGRVIPLTGELLEILKLQRQKRDVECPGCEFVFFQDGRRILDFRKSWETACKKAGLGRLLFHDLRRTAVRNLVRAGVPERVAMAISGHKTPEVFARYNIVSGRDLRDAATNLEDYLAGQNGASSGRINASKAEREERTRLTN